MAWMIRRDYAAMYGPTTGDAVRLGDTALLGRGRARLSRSRARNACTAAARRCATAWGSPPGYDSADGALDMLICNAVVIDPVLGIVKGDIGIKDGPHRRHRQGRQSRRSMDGVDAKLIVRRRNHRARCRGPDRHPGRHRRPRPLRQRAALRARDRLGHHHHDRRLARADHRRHRLRRRRGTSARCCRPPSTGRSTSASSAAATPPSRARCSSRSRPAAIGLKIHEDWGAMPAVIDCCLVGRRRAGLPGAAPHRHPERERLPRGHAGGDQRPHHPHVPHRGRRRRPCAGHHPRAPARRTACRPRPTRPTPTP